MKSKKWLIFFLGILASVSVAFVILRIAAPMDMNRSVYINIQMPQNNNQDIHNIENLEINMPHIASLPEMPLPGAAQNISISPAPPAVNVPVLMYHHLADYADNDAVITPESFAVQMRALRDNGFTAITLQQLIDYVDEGIALPDRPIIITFDDGYLSVYTYAFPILARYGMHAVSFIIGHTVGTYTYKDTGHPTIPKFDFQQARNMAGVMSIQSHTYDMHQWPPFEAGRARENILIWPDENVYVYESILRADHQRISDLVYTEVGAQVIAIAFPHGQHDALSHQILQDMGVRVTFTTEPGWNLVVKGDATSLIALNRFNVTDDICEVLLMDMLRSE